MALIKCPECGKEISDKARRCPKCGKALKSNRALDSDASFRPMSTSEKSKKFYEKGWFCILMLILFFPVGLFLMWRYKIFSKTARTIITVFIAIAFVGNVLLNNTADSENQESETTIQNTEKSNKVTTESQKETTEKKVEEKTTTALEDDVDKTEFEYKNMTVKYLNHQIQTDAANQECLIVYYEFTNNSDKTQTFDYCFDDKVFQNGVELESSYFHANDETKNSGKEIKPGVTITVASSFVLTENRSNVELEVSPFMSFDDKILMRVAMAL